MGGTDIRTVQELLGHEGIRMAMRYYHLAPDHLQKALQILDAPQKILMERFLMDTKDVQNENQVLPVKDNALVSCCNSW